MKIYPSQDGGIWAKGIRESDRVDVDWSARLGGVVFVVGVFFDRWLELVKPEDVIGSILSIGQA
jgi:hypothetical protein